MGVKHKESKAREILLQWFTFGYVDLKIICNNACYDQ